MCLTSQGFEVSWETPSHKMKWRGREDKVLSPPHACTWTLMHTLRYTRTLYIHSTHAGVQVKVRHFMHHATLDNNGHLAMIGTRRHASLNSLTCFPLWPFQVAEGWHADEM